MAASLVITRTVRNAAGNLVDLPSAPVLRDPTAAYGLRRDDTEAAIVAAGTTIPRVSLGTYSLQVDDLVAGVLYRYWIETTLASGGISRIEKTWTAAAESDAPCYLTVAEADALAEQLPASQTANYTAAATDAIRLAALVAATAAIDVAMRYQGRKYAAGQVLEFPRVPYENSTTIWDLDTDGETVIVPRNVRVACLLQANAVLDATDAERQRRIELIRQGMTARTTGALSESFGQLIATHAELQLVSPVAALLGRYRLTTGAIR